MLRSVLVVLFFWRAVADERCVGGWQAGYGGGWDYQTYVGTYASREQCIDAVESLDDGANAATYGYSSCYAEYGQTTVYYATDWENCPFASDALSTGSRDLDGDGVADAAAEGDCCINGYGMSFADSSCGNTLAEVAASCCWSPFVARYSIQPDGEDQNVNQNAFDCVSFISKEDCNARGALWSDDSQMPGQCRHTVNGDWGTGNGWCSSDLDELIGSTSDANACWTMCESRYVDLVAIDWTPDGECWCQNDCQCMEDTHDGDIHLITRSDIASLPNACSAPTCPGQMECGFGYACAADEFCNFDGGSYGSCEKCSDEDHCDRGLPSAGEADCEACCGIKKESNRDNVGLLILIIVCSVMGVCCLLALGTAAAFGAFGSCACFAKRKKMPARVAEPSSSAASAPVPLAVAEYVAAPPPMAPETLAKTQEHIRRTAALMTEGPPSPGPPPLAPIKATETLAAERP